MKCSLLDSMIPWRSSRRRPLVLCVLLLFTIVSHSQTTPPDVPSGFIPGLMNRFAGNGNSSGYVDQAVAVDTAAVSPQAIASDSHGNIVFATGSFPTSTSAQSTYMVYAGGAVPPILASVTTQATPAITPVAGHIYQIIGAGTCSYYGCYGSSGANSGDPITDASFVDITSMWFDSSDNLYLADAASMCVFEVVQNFQKNTTSVNLVAGTYYDFSDPVTTTGVATSAVLANPSDVKTDKWGNIYIADIGSGDAGTNDYSVLVVYTGTQAPPVLAAEGIPTTASDQGNLYAIAGQTGNTCSSAGTCTDNGTASGSLLGYPVSIAADAAGNVYILDQTELTIRVIYADASTGTVPPLLAAEGYSASNPPKLGNIYTIAGANHEFSPCSAATCGDSGLAADLRFKAPQYMSVDTSGNVYVADFGDRAVRKIDSSGYVSTVAGIADPTATPPTVPPDADSSSPATSTQLYGPDGIAFDSQNNLYIADSGYDLVWQVAPALAQTIDFPALEKPITYGIGPISLNATVSSSPNSGNPITYGVTGPATLSNSTLTITGVGTVTVTASVAGTTTAPIYAPASVSQSFTVNQGIQSITFAQSLPPSAIYGASPITLSVTSDTPNSGNPVNLAVTGSASLSVSTLASTGGSSTLTITGAGPVSVTASQAGSANYATGSATESLTVSPVALTVTANNQSRQYGQPNPTLTYSIATFVNGDTQATAISGGPSVTTTATQTSPAGNTYPITITQGNLAANATIPGYPNYTFAAFDNGTLSVTGGASQTITFTQSLPNVISGASPITLNATTNSGLAITYKVTGPATFGGSATTTSLVPVPLTITGAGPVTITASQAGNANYAGAISVSRSFTVAPAVLTVTATSFSQTTVPTTLTYSITGFVPGDSQTTATTGAPSLSTTATAASAPNTYPITITQGALAANATIPNYPNYTFNLVNGTLTLLPRTAQTISFSPLSNVTYGATSIALDATANSGLAVTYTVTGPANFGGSATTTAIGPVTLTVTGVGPVGIATSQPGNAVYAPAQTVTQSFQVLPATLTVSANPVTRVYNQPNPAFTYAVTGFVNGDSQTVLSGAPAFSTTATQTSDPNVYPLTISQGKLSASNYTFGFVNSTVTVTQASQTISTLPLPTVTYGAYPKVTATANSSLPVSVTFTGPLAYYGSTGVTNPGAGNNTVELNAIGVGPATITIIQSGTTDYAAATPVVLNFSVNQAPLDITAVNVTREQGAPNPTFTYQVGTSAAGAVGGFQNNDTDIPSVVSGIPVLTTTATQSSSAGTYAIVPSLGTLTSTNYYFNFINGTLTVTPPGSYTISANPSSLTIARGQSAQSTIIITPSNAYQGTVTLSCGQLPANVSCTISPATYTFPGSQNADGSENPAQGTILINTTAGTVVGALPAEKSNLRLAGFLIPGAIAGLFLVFARKRIGKSSAIWSLCALLTLGLGMLAVTSCGGSSGLTTAAPGTVTVTISGSGTTPSGSGTVTATVPLTVTIQ
jgi:hypothetical protein